MDASANLARNVVYTRYEDIPAGTLEITKRDILDTLATAVAGSTAPGSKEIVALVTDWGGKKESTIIGYGTSVPANLAALANGTMAHALDYDDTHDEARLHTGVCVVPACFAIAERKGQVSGKEFIAAVTLGIDLHCRLGLATKLTPDQSGWIYTPLYGYLSAAAAAGKLLGLDEDKMINALGIAYSQVAGNMQCIRDGALTKRFQAGFASSGGVLSALMAQAGITGAQNVLEGQYSLSNVYHQGKFDRSALLADLGKRFEGAGLSFKPYACCRATHPSIDAMLAIIREHDVKPEDIDSIDIFTGETSHSVCEPRERKVNPQTVVDAQFSIPYAVAVAAVRKKVLIGDFSKKAIEDPLVLSVARKVSTHLSPEFTTRGVEPALVEVKTKCAKYSKRVDKSKGGPGEPMTTEEFASKFRECAGYAPKPLSEGTIDNLTQMILNLEEANDVAEVMRLLR